MDVYNVILDIMDEFLIFKLIIALNIVMINKNVKNVFLDILLVKIN